MAYACEVGFFTAQAGTGDQAVTLADSGLTPKSVELFTVGRTVAAPLVGANTVAAHGYGTIRGGTVQQVVHSFMSLDAASTSQPSGLCNTGFILRGLTPNASTTVEAFAATLVSFAAGTFTINWSNVVDTASQRVMYIVRGGSDITDALAFSLAGNNAATQNVDVSALTGGTGWTGKPDLVHLAHGASSGLTSGQSGAYAFSQAIFNQTQAGYATIWLEDGADENVVGDQRSNGPVVMARAGTSGGDPVIDQATVSAAASWPTNGFQLAWSLTATLGMVGLAHQGTFQTNIDAVASATSITTVDETASFDPVETYVWGLNMPATASSITADNTAQWGGYGIGAFDGTHQGYGGFTEDDAAATSATGQHWSETSGLRSIDAGGTPVVQGAATISHPGSGVSRFTWTDADNVSRSYLILQVGSAAGGGGTTDPAPQGLATGTGISPTARADSSAGAATGTATGPTARATASPGLATATGVTPNSTASETATRGTATATGTPPTAAATTPAGQATGTGTSPTAAAALAPGLATGTGVTPSATSTDTANRGTAAGTGTAPTVRVAANAGTAATTSAGPTVAAALTRGTGTGTGVPPTDGASSSDTAPQGTATATGITPGTTTTLTATPGTATGAGITPTSSTTATPNVGTASGTGTTPTPAISQAATRGTATGQGISPTDTSNTTDHAPQGLATGQGVTPSSTTRLSTLQGVASTAATPPTPTVSLTHGTATGTGTTPGQATHATLTPGLAVGHGITPTISVNRWAPSTGTHWDPDTSPRWPHTAGTTWPTDTSTRWDTTSSSRWD